jgi:hypothetical protein
MLTYAEKQTLKSAGQHVTMIDRTYVSARSGQPVAGMSDAGWAELTGRLANVGTVQAFTASDGTDGVIVICDAQRGPSGAFAAHDLGCRYGASSVVL